MLPPHLPNARKARTAPTPVRSSREKLAVIESLAILLAKKAPARELRVLGRKAPRAAKPVLKVLKSSTGDGAAC